MKYRCLVIDDEELAIDIISNYINEINNLEVTASCSNAVEAFNILQKESIDLIFLDINMPLISGIEFLRNLDNPPKVIFTTAYREFAAESYELDVLDYLVKPISMERFIRAVNKFFTAVKSSASLPTEPVDIVKDDKFIFVKSDKNMVKILLEDILWIEGLKNYVKILTSSRSVIVYNSMGNMEQSLPHGLFLRIHRSYIVPLQKIEEFNMSSVRIDSNWLSIGVNYRKMVHKQLEDYVKQGRKET